MNCTTITSVSLRVVVKVHKIVTEQFYQKMITTRKQILLALDNLREIIFKLPLFLSSLIDELILKMKTILNCKKGDEGGKCVMNL